MLKSDEILIKAAAAKGAALLDTRLPGWHTEINVGELEMASCSRCILGQLFLEDTKKGRSAFTVGFKVLFNDQPPVRDVGTEFGFDSPGYLLEDFDPKDDDPGAWDILREAWVDEIKRRFTDE